MKDQTNKAAVGEFARNVLNTSSFTRVVYYKIICNSSNIIIISEHWTVSRMG